MGAVGIPVSTKVRGFGAREETRGCTGRNCGSQLGAGMSPPICGCWDIIPFPCQSSWSCGKGANGKRIPVGSIIQQAPGSGYPL